MKLLPVFLLCLVVFVRSQPQFFALFDYSVPKIDGSADDKSSLFANIVNDSDTKNLIPLKSIHGDGGEAMSLMYYLINNKTTPYTSAILVFDNEIYTPGRRLNDYATIDTFRYQTDIVDDNLVVTTSIFGVYHEVFRIEKKQSFTVIALAINFQTIKNATVSTVYYMDSDNKKAEATKTINDTNPSLLTADFIEYAHSFGNFYYAGFSHQEISKSVFTAWVDGYVNTLHKKAECENCKESLTCTANAHLRPSPMGMRKYKCTCKEDSAVYDQTASSIDCIKLVYGKSCSFGCGCACASIDSEMCYENCTPGYNKTALGKNFFTCAPMSGEHKSFWFYIFVVTIPIFIVAYIAKVIIYIVYNNSSKPAPIQDTSYPNPKSYGLAGQNSPTMTNVMTSGPGSPIPMHKKPGSAIPESEIDTYKPSLVKVEDEKEFRFGSSGRQSDSEKSEPKTCKLCGKTKDDLTAAFKCRHADVCKECLKGIKRCPTCGNNSLLLK